MPITKTRSHVVAEIADLTADYLVISDCR